METRKFGNRRYIFMVSDATGQTCMRVVKAALRQFNTTQAVLDITRNVRTLSQIEKVVKKAADANGIIIYTFVSPACRNRITELGRLEGVPIVDLLGPLLTRFSDLLELSPLAKPGLGRQLDDDYFRRIEAIDFTIKHDDSLGLPTINQAECILLGVSRTTKTPVSIYLSYRGWKVANIPIIKDYPLPPQVKELDQRRIIALTVKPSRLQMIRIERQKKLNNAELENYTDPNEVRHEVAYSMELYAKHNYPVIDVTYKSIEETATEVMRIIYAQIGEKKGKIPSELIANGIF